MSMIREGNRDIIEKLLLDVASSKLREYKDKKEWDKLFVNAGEFFSKKVEGGERIIEDVSLLLSQENMKELAEKTREASKFWLKDTLHRELKRLMLQYEIPDQEAEFYISNFIIVVMKEMERVDPDAVQCAYMYEWRNEEENNLTRIERSINMLNTQLREIREKSVEIYSLEQVEIELARRTLNPSLDLSFFEVDDERFKENFKRCINDDCIYISGQCKEETIYCVLNELRRLNTGRMVLVVKKEEDWEKLRSANEEHPELGKKILIPWFSAEHIFAITNNTNIFVYGSGEYSVGKDVINIRKRKSSTIIRKLEEAGVSYEEARTMVNDTHGLYVPLKKKIIRGQYSTIPSWVEGEDDLIIPLFLCGQWTETEGDQAVLEDLCGRKYNQIIEDIETYIRGEEPLFVRFKSYGGTIYHLASVENAWDYLDDKVVVGDKLWTKYVDNILEIVSEPDPVYFFPEEQQRYAELLPEGKPFWSTTLKKGMLRSLIMKAYYKKNIDSQNAIDEVVGKVLDKIQNQNQWFSIAEYFMLLCEASPKAVMQRLDDERINDTGFIAAFSKEDEDVLFGKHFYAYFIWGVEQFLAQKEYAAWAIRWLIKMYDLKKKYSISNSPSESLKKAFYARYNFTALSQEDKIFLAEEAFANNYDIWDVLCDELQNGNTCLLTSLSKPTYRMIEEPLVATWSDMCLANKEYVHLCLNHMEVELERWKKILMVDHLDSELRKMMFDKLDYEMEFMTDEDIFAIKGVIRDKIYRHRYFSNEEWSMNEEELEEFESALTRIVTKNPVYEYAHLFAHAINVPLLHPCPYSQDKSGKVNDRLRENEIKQSLLEFKKQGLSVEELVSICSKCEYTTLGKYLFEIYSDGIFDEELFKLLLGKRDYKNTMLLYARTAYLANSGYLIEAVAIAKANNAEEDVIVRLLLIEEIQAEKTLLISNESIEIKKKYWRNGFGYIRGDDERTCRYVVEEMSKYSDQVTMIATLQECLKYFQPKEILEIAESLDTMEVGNDVLSMLSYGLKRILEVIQCEYCDTENCMRVARLELRYREILKWQDMVCFKKCLECSPKLYAEMISIVGRKDGQEVQATTESDEQCIRRVRSLFYDTKFCPAESNGKVDKAALFDWILEFRELLGQQRQMSLFTYLLGHVFSCSPIGEDGFYPCESIRDAIQQYGDESLEKEYMVCVFNQRGVFSSTGGDAERKLADQYKNNADALRVKYPKVASIYDKIYESYLCEANLERELEEYVGF